MSDATARAFIILIWLIGAWACTVEIRFWLMIP